jgi:hypothetical protein
MLPVVTVRGLISEMKRHSGPEIWKFSVVLSCVPVNIATSSSLTRQEACWVVDSPVVPVVVPVVPVVLVPVVLVPVVDCPHAGNVNTKRKVRDTNIVRKYGTDFPLLVIYHTNRLTIAYRSKQCNVLGKRDVATSPAAATGIRTFDNTSTTTHLQRIALMLASVLGPIDLHAWQWKLSAVLGARVRLHASIALPGSIS